MLYYSGSIIAHSCAGKAPFSSLTTAVDTILEHPNPVLASFKHSY